MYDWLIPAALAIDICMGDPRRMIHPVVLIGGLISRLQVPLAGLLSSRRQAGILLTFLTLSITGAVTWALIFVAGLAASALQAAVSLWLAYTTLALGELHRESRAVVRLVEEGNLGEARRALALIVGRETATLDEEGILRACIETVSENTSDGIVAPMFYLFVGGPVLAMMYKAANTLDSMVGYRDDQYRELGWASARFDDLVNLIPARLTGMLMVVASIPLGLNSLNALRILLRDARKTSSPNAGFPESATAGALGIRLGGPAVYFGQRVEKPTLGDADTPITVGAYKATVRLMYVTSFLALGLGLLLTGGLF